MLSSMDIKVALMRRQVSMASIAGAINCDRTQVSRVVARKLETPYIRRGIAKALSMSYLDVWGVSDPEVDRLPSGRAALKLQVTRVHSIKPAGKGAA